MYHPNVTHDNEIITNELNWWEEDYTLTDILAGVEKAVVMEDLDNYMEDAVLEEYKENPSKFADTAREWTEKYAMEWNHASERELERQRQLDLTGKVRSLARKRASLLDK